MFELSDCIAVCHSRSFFFDLSRAIVLMTASILLNAQSAARSIFRIALVKISKLILLCSFCVILSHKTLKSSKIHGNTDCKANSMTADRNISLMNMPIMRSRHIAGSISVLKRFSYILYLVVPSR